jgi:hypothetical protein
MKKTAISLFLMLLVVLSVNAQQKSSEILGAWKLVSLRYGEGEIQYVSDSLQRIKLITPTYFTWVHFLTKDKTVRDSAGGTYVLDGGNYIEKIDFGGRGMTSYLNKTQAFKIKIEDNKMYLFGELSDKLKIEEIWEKIEAK